MTRVPSQRPNPTSTPASDTSRIGASAARCSAVRAGAPDDGRMNWPRTTACSSASVSRTAARSSPMSSGLSRAAKPVEAAIDSAVEPAEDPAARPSPRPRGRNDRDGLGQPERSAGRPGQRAEVGTAAKGQAEIPGNRPDVGAGGAIDLDDRDRTRRIGGIPLEDLQAVDRDRARGELWRATRPGHGVGSPARNLDRGIGRRDLDDRTAKGLEGRVEGGPLNRGSVDGRELAVEVVGGR